MSTHKGLENMDDDKNETETHDGLFEDNLEETDYGLIVCGKTGNLKGLWIPKGQDDEEVPESLVRICVDVFGIDENEFFTSDDDLGTPPTETLH